MDVRFRGKSGRAADNTRMTESDPGCVKTHTVAKCRNNNSPGRHHASRVQYDLTLRYAIPSRSFYARSKGWSFYTAKTPTGHERASFAAVHGPDLLYFHDGDETARVHYAPGRRYGCMAARDAGTATWDGAARGYALSWSTSRRR